MIEFVLKFISLGKPMTSLPLYTLPIRHSWGNLLFVSNYLDYFFSFMSKVNLFCDMKIIFNSQKETQDNLFASKLTMTLSK